MTRQITLLRMTDALKAHFATHGWAQTQTRLCSGSAPRSSRVGCLHRDGNAAWAVQPFRLPRVLEVLNLPLCAQEARIHFDVYNHWYWKYCIFITKTVKVVILLLLSSMDTNTVVCSMFCFLFLGAKHCMRRADTFFRTRMSLIIFPSIRIDRHITWVNVVLSCGPCAFDDSLKVMRAAYSPKYTCYIWP